MKQAINTLMESRRFAVIVLICITYFLLPTCKPTLYDDHFVSGELEIEARFNEDRSMVLYTATNLTDRDILYECVVLECQIEDDWYEILNILFQRQTPHSYTAHDSPACGLDFPAGESVQGSLSVEHLHLANRSAYRLVFPYRNTSVIAVSPVFS